MKAASTHIRNAMGAIAGLRERVSQSAGLASALHDIKAFQAQRFAHTYRDLLESPTYKGCADFFLTELYSERNYENRDQQFAKVAKVIEVSFPESVIETAVILAQLHHVTETLDVAMAEQWSRAASPSRATRYLHAWRELDCSTQRQWQLETVITIGQQLGDLTRRRGLRLLLKMMRRPAELAGLTELQVFLETGFDQFSQLARKKEALDGFLEIIRSRETSWINNLDSTGEPEVDFATANRNCATHLDPIAF